MRWELQRKFDSGVADPHAAVAVDNVLRKASSIVNEIKVSSSLLFLFPNVEWVEFLG